jgi:hypothetical protein
MTLSNSVENGSTVFDPGLMQIQISANTAAERNMRELRRLLRSPETKASPGREF